MRGWEAHGTEQCPADTRGSGGHSRKVRGGIAGERHPELLLCSITRGIFCERRTGISPSARRRLAREAFPPFETRRRVRTRGHGARPCARTSTQSHAQDRKTSAPAEPALMRHCLIAAASMAADGRERLPLQEQEGESAPTGRTAPRSAAQQHVRERAPAATDRAARARARARPLPVSSPRNPAARCSSFDTSGEVAGGGKERGCSHLGASELELAAQAGFAPNPACCSTGPA